MNSPNQNPNQSHDDDHMKRTDYYDYMDEEQIYNGISFDDLHHVDSISRFHTDEELEAVVKELLMNSKRINADDITVTVDNCNVTLSGTVHSQYERDYAVSIVKLVHGVGDVHSELIVKLNDGITPTDIGRDSQH